MSRFTYGPAEHGEVAQMMTAIVEALKPFRARGVSPVLAAMALLRCIRAVTLRMPDSQHAALVKAGQAYLEGKTVAGNNEIFSGLIH